jgi:Family of unknown function (DUF5678)
MDAATFERETALNRQAYEAMRGQVRREYAGCYVALGQGRILASAPTYDEAMAAVQQLRPAPEFFLVFPADEEPAFEPYCAY